MRACLKPQLAGAPHGSDGPVGIVTMRRKENAAHKEMGAGIAASPHMRRAKDMPVFVTWSPENPKAPNDPLSILAHQLRRRFPSDRSLRRGA